MKKLLLISFILTTSLFGYSYNDLLIKAQSSIFPKILLLDKKLDQWVPGDFNILLQGFTGVTQQT